MKTRLMALMSMAALPAAAPADLIDVPDPGAGINSVADAIAIAQPGDTIRIAAGTYTERNVLTTPGVTIEGVGDVILRTPTISCDLSTAPALIVDGAGGVVLSNLAFEGAGGTICGGHTAVTGPGTRAFSAVGAGVILDSCTFIGGQYQDAARFESSTVDAFACSFAGANGRGAIANTILPGSSTPATNGGDGIEILDCTIRLSACEVRAGMGGNGILVVFFPIFALPAADGGVGIRALGADTLELDDSLVRGGDGGGPGSGVVGGDGGCGITGTPGLIYAAGNSTVQGGDIGPSGGSSGAAICGFTPSGISRWDHYE